MCDLARGVIVRRLAGSTIFQTSELVLVHPEGRFNLILSLRYLYWYFCLFSAKKRKIKLIRPTVPQKQEKNNWLSDDEEEQDKDGLFNQYLGQEKPKRARKPAEPVRETKQRQRKPKFDEEDSVDANEDEKCFLCGEQFPAGLSQTAYEQHVNECVDKSERMELMKQSGKDFGKYHMFDFLKFFIIQNIYQCSKNLSKNRNHFLKDLG